MSTQPLFASVLLDRGLEKILDYEIPQHFHEKVFPGMRVEVPIKSSFRKGFVLAVKTAPSFPNVKPLHQVLSDEVFSPKLFELALWISNYYRAPLQKVLLYMIPSSIREDVHLKEQIYLSCPHSKKEILSLLETLQKNPSQASVLNCFLENNEGFFLSALLKKVKTSKSPVDQLIKKNVLIAKKAPKNFLEEAIYFPSAPKILTEEQKACFEKISKSLELGIYETHLIHGVTGSGKTEIYLQAIEKALSLGKSAIFLVPEISLTSQMIEKLKTRFQHQIAILHHKRSKGERFAAWNDLKMGKISIVIGARSAIFSPVQNLGLIIVDEEHDASYKQSEEAPCYHARNVAVMRGKLFSCTVLLGSATPSLESFWNVEKKKYTLSVLKQRANQATLPEVQIVDMQKEWERSSNFTHFSSPLISEMQKRLEKGEQTLLFLNRRGFHSFLLCTSCLHVIKCPHCNLSLTFHKKENILSCHLCNYEIHPPRECPSCKSSDYMKYKGYGTEHVENSLHTLFPSIRTLRIDRDTTRKKNSHDILFKEFRAGKADVLIGTQMIVKGLHFPSVTLVGVLNFDGALHLPDFRAGETVFQLLTQVAGRSGRSEIKGKVIIQTLMPSHPIIQLAAKQDFLSFYTEELESRKIFDYPPFSHLVKISFSGPEELLTKECAESFRNETILLLSKENVIHPVVASGHPKIKNFYRFFFLIKGKQISPITNILEKILKKKNFSKTFRILIDVDPLSTFF